MTLRTYIALRKIAADPANQEKNLLLGPAPTVTDPDNEGYYSNGRGGYGIMPHGTAQKMGWTKTTKDEFERSHNEARQREEKRIAEQKRLAAQNSASGMVQHPKTGMWYNPVQARATQQKMQNWQNGGKQAATAAWNKTDPNKARAEISQRAQKRQNGGLTTQAEYALRTGAVAPTDKQLTAARVQSYGQRGMSTNQQLGQPTYRYPTVGDKAERLWRARFPEAHFSANKFNRMWNRMLKDPMYHGEEGQRLLEEKRKRIWESINQAFPSTYGIDGDERDEGNPNNEDITPSNSPNAPYISDTPYWQQVMDYYDTPNKLQQR